jgi:hypothetical protein
MRTGNGKWKSITPSSYADEAHLQKMLYDSPELIPIQNDEAFAVFIREAGLPGSGSTDLLGVDSQGNVLIVETKLARNQEARRKVVGQILEYASFLWRMSFDELDELFVRRREKSLLEVLAEQAPDLPIDAIRDTIKRNLAEGKFQLLIAVDQINDELERIISYFAECGGGIHLEALELELYVDGATQILVPKRYGTGSETASPTSRARLLTVPEVLDRATGVARERLQHLFDLWSASGNRIEPGTQGASFKAEIDGRMQPIFWAFPTILQAAFSELAKRAAPEKAIKDFRDTAAACEGFDPAKATSAAQPTAKLSDLTAADVKRFVDAAILLVQRWREQLSKSKDHGASAAG